MELGAQTQRIAETEDLIYAQRAIDNALSRVESLASADVDIHSIVLDVEFGEEKEVMGYNGGKCSMRTEQCSAAGAELQGHLVDLGCPSQLEAGLAESHGVTLELLNSLVAEFGGRAALRGLSINQVRDTYIAPARDQAGGSFLDYLRGQSRFANQVRPATVFVSYNLGCLFLDFVDAINLCYSQVPDSVRAQVVLFVTVFSNNFSLWVRQHGGLFPPPPVMLGHVVQLAANIPSMLLVLCQWENSGKTPMNRLWCLVELFVAAFLQHHLLIATCTKRSHFVGTSLDYKADLVKSFLSCIDIAGARTFSPQYDAVIQQLVVKCGGAAACNSAIRQMIQSHTRLPMMIRQKSLDVERLAFVVLDLDVLMQDTCGRQFLEEVARCNVGFLRESLCDENTCDVLSIFSSTIRNSCHLGDSISKLKVEAEFLPHLLFADAKVNRSRYRDDISVAAYVSYCDRHLNPSDFHLSMDPDIAHMLTRLSRCAHLVLFSNLTEITISRYLDARGLDETFDYILYSDIQFLQPEQSSVHDARSEADATGGVVLDSQVCSEVEVGEGTKADMGTGTGMAIRLNLKPHLHVFNQAMLRMGVGTRHPEREIDRVFYVDTEDYNLEAAKRLGWIGTKVNSVGSSTMSTLATSRAVATEQITGTPEVSSLVELGQLEQWKDLLSPDLYPNEISGMSSSADRHSASAGLMRSLSLTDDIQLHWADDVEEDISDYTVDSQGYSKQAIFPISLSDQDIASARSQATTPIHVTITTATPNLTAADTNISSSSSTTTTTAKPVKLCCRRDGITISGPEDVAEGETYYEEDPDLYNHILQPYYSSLPQPHVLVRDYSGGSKFYNRCARRGWVALFGSSGNLSARHCLPPSVPREGAFLLMPNPGYHDPLTKAIKDCMRKKISVGELETIRLRELEACARDPCGKELDYSESGFIYTAWWIQPEDLPLVARVLDELRAEGEEGGEASSSAAQSLHSSESGSTLRPDLGLGQPLDSALFDQQLNPSPPLSNSSGGMHCGVVPLQRQNSSAPTLGGYTLAAPHYTRHPGYLHSLRALKGLHVPLLQSLVKNVPVWLQELHGNSGSSSSSSSSSSSGSSSSGSGGSEADLGTIVAEMGVHYPYIDHFTTLHVHIRTATYPNCDSGNDRGIFDLQDIIALLTEDSGVMDACIVSGLMTKLTKGWIDALRKNCPSRDLLDIQPDIEDPRVLRLGCKFRDFQFGNDDFDEDEAEMGLGDVMEQERKSSDDAARHDNLSADAPYTDDCISASGSGSGSGGEAVVRKMLKKRPTAAPDSSSDDESKDYSDAFARQVAAQIEVFPEFADVTAAGEEKDQEVRKGGEQRQPLRVGEEADLQIQTLDGEADLCVVSADPIPAVSTAEVSMRSNELNSRTPFSQSISFLAACLNKRPDMGFHDSRSAASAGSGYGGRSRDLISGAGDVSRVIRGVDDSSMTIANVDTIASPSRCGHLQSLTIISVVGPPAIGKNTALKPLCFYRNWIHLSAGDLLRSALEDNDGDGDGDSKSDSIQAATAATRPTTTATSTNQSYRGVLGRLLKKAQQTTAKDLKDRYWKRIDKYAGLLVVKYLSDSVCVPFGSTVVLDNFPRTLDELGVLRDHGVCLSAYVNIGVTTPCTKDQNYIIDLLAERMRNRSRGVIDLQPAAAQRRIKHYFGVMVPQIEATMSALEAPPHSPQPSRVQQTLCARVELSGEESVGTMIERITAAIAPIFQSPQSIHEDRGFGCDIESMSTVPAIAPLLRANSAPF